ncbi:MULTISPECIES: MATE family efflux transporter [unclassified Granulicatella]|uniref:MATE family efflux transporter n=1 Tax=unclassified Granulicatella TaxID=2630493 RepID=UPI001431189E|nr:MULTISPECIES: MATE family efflux transporter [unclassified Granulicatella]MBF0780271.1 MATE family efflux transporter [Granulicatella sp. 19428wC4_WM01]
MFKNKFYSEYIKIVIPILLQSLLTTLVSVVDNLMVGQLGDEAIAAVAMANRILGIMIFTIFGVGVASSVFIAQYYGAKNIEKQKESFRTGIILSIIVYALFTMSYFSFSSDIVRFFIQSETIEQYTIEYISIMLVGCAPYLLTINYFDALRVIGQVKLPLIASLVGVGVNTCLNYVLIFGHFGFSRMGVAGAAIATVISRIVEFLLIYCAVCYYKFEFNTKWRELCHISSDLFRRIYVKTLPLVFNEIIFAFAQATILKLYGVRGGEVVAAYSISDTTRSIFYAFMTGASVATPIFISQRLGAGKLDEAYWNAKMMLKTVGIVSIILGGIMFGTSYIVPDLYHISEHSHQLSVELIQISAILFWASLFNSQIYYIMRAGGDMTSTLVMDGLFYWCVTIPALAIATYFTSLPIILVYVVGQCCEIGKMGISFIFFFKKKWLKNLTE